VHEIFRERLLEGRVIGLTTGARAGLAGGLEALGADIRAVAADPAEAPPPEPLRELDVLVVDAAALFAGAAGDDELAPLRAAADGAWAAVRAVANAAWIERRRPGKVVLLAPRPDAGPHAEGARAALENMARTLSIEWSRHGVKPTAITPGERTGDAEVAQLVAYLASPGGDYFSGARLDLA